MAALRGEDGACKDDTMDVDEPGSTTEPTERVNEPFSDAWFADLDESIDAITNAFEELRLSQAEPEVNDDITDAERGLFDVQNELMECLEALHSAKQKLRKSEGGSDERKFVVGHDNNNWSRAGSHDGHDRRPRSQPFYARTPERYGHNEAFEAPTSSMASRSSLAPGEKVMKQLFRWWRPCRPGCVRDAKRLKEGRMTEVDGRLIQ